MASITPHRPHRRLADYSADYRMLLLAAMAVVAGTGGAFSAWALLTLTCSRYASGTGIRKMPARGAAPDRVALKGALR